MSKKLQRFESLLQLMIDLGFPSSVRRISRTRKETQRKNVHRWRSEKVRRQAQSRVVV